MVYVNHVFSLPLLICIWLIELYLFMAVARLILSKVPSAQPTHLYQNLKLLVDFVPNALHRRLARNREKTIPSWTSWFIVILSGFIIRQALKVMATT